MSTSDAMRNFSSLTSSTDIIQIYPTAFPLLSLKDDNVMVQRATSASIIVICYSDCHQFRGKGWARGEEGCVCGGVLVFLCKFCPVYGQKMYLRMVLYLLLIKV